MILVDTNVMSEPLRREPSAAVIEWLDAQNVETLFLAAISLGEMRFGVAALPEGRRRDWLHQSIEQRVVPLFRGRILP
ncbi:PIN domain-containing protein, partial [Clostridioides difficile]|nr:PIN domain-containing protein [Clostridioides difficile]